MALEIYKKSQGKNTRLVSALVVAVICAIGCYRLYELLSANIANQWIQTMLPVALFVFFSILIFWLVNKPSLADFLILAEGEMKKVSWSSRKEIIVSTVVVISVVVIMAALLGVTDLLLSWLFREFFAI
jgi:preprotein translocase subunit SecE